MNREIKFRAWDGKVMITSDNGDFFVDLEGDVWQNRGFCEDLLSHRKDLMIMQFTGLKDKNGVEIYEGDWCRAEFRGMIGIKVIQGNIFMDEYMWCIDSGDEIFSINRPHNFEVIGNIYENPELLNQ